MESALADVSSTSIRAVTYILYIFWTCMHEPYISDDISYQSKNGCGQVKYNHHWTCMHEQIGDYKMWSQNVAKVY